MSEVRVRFAPSPTGFVHVGSLRTALYNFLFARHFNGRFVLRIEDTDQARYVEGAVENLLRVLSWAGLEFDEGPGKGGAYSPYLQSERLNLYREQVRFLIDQGKAYPCFCSTERLEKMRLDQVARGEDFKYDGTCRKIVFEEAVQRMKSEAHVIRMRIPENEAIIVDDIIRGRVTFRSDSLDDQVLIKSDGFPTYHLANVVDDHFMRISHVIRGEEWLPSTPKHVILYQAFGWDIPNFAHLPLLLNKDRSKLSKRQGDVAVEDYQARGILAYALLNFVALLGWNKGDEQEIFTLGELIKYFSLERVNKAGAVFDFNKLIWMNGQYIRKLPDEEYIKIGIEWLKKENLDTGNEQTNQQVLLGVRNHINQFSELREATKVFFGEDLLYTAEALEWLKMAESKTIFSKILEQLHTVNELTLDSFKILMKNVQSETGIKGKELWMPVRAAITGQTSGPELPVVMSVVGKERITALIKQAIEK